MSEQEKKVVIRFESGHSLNQGVLTFVKDQSGPLLKNIHFAGALRNITGAQFFALANQIESEIENQRSGAADQLTVIPQNLPAGKGTLLPRTGSKVFDSLAAKVENDIMKNAASMTEREKAAAKSGIAALWQILGLSK